MSLTLMVERKVVPGEQGALKSLLRELRSGATLQPDFISGRSVVDAFNPTIFMTISTWSSIAVWEDWESQPARRAIIDRINELVQGEPVVRMWLDDDDAPSGAM
jgi:quinol monooxygenase YgiN